MDIERGIIKALFYDFPLERFVEIMDVEEAERDWNSLFTTIPNLMKWNMPAFDIQELKNIVNSKTKEWCEQFKEYDKQAWPLFFVASTAKEFLVLEKDKPKVKSEQLLRWRTISQYVSEDLLSLSWLAYIDREKTGIRENFVWEDTIPIMEKDWKELCGSYRLYDIHSHLGASCDAFNIRWIYWMNKCCGEKCLRREKKEELFCLDKYDRENSQDNPISLWSSKISLTLMQWAGIASTIRYYLNEICNGSEIAEDKKRDIIDAVKDDTLIILLIDDIYGKIATAKNMSMKPNIGQIGHWDYAINNQLAIPQKDISSPYMLHIGERSLIYTFFRKLYNKQSNAIKFVDLFYFYLLIKTRCRKEFIQTNNLIGLSNYQEYEWNNSHHGLANMGEAKRRYAIQTALGTKQNNYLESRVSWERNNMNKKPILDAKIEESLFGTKTLNRKVLLKKIRLVVSYSKKDFKVENKIVELKKLTDIFEQIAATIVSNKNLRNKEFSIVGIDFTGSDRCARPEMYAQLIRYARCHEKIKFKQFTYHVGEDFYDLLDGLRTIDEVLCYLKWNKNCRFSHAMALTIQPNHYYERRGRNVIAPRQILLDNLVWYLKMTTKVQFKMDPSLKKNISEEIETLYKEIGYSTPFDMKKYMQSMKLRTDHPIGAGRSDGRSLFVQTALCNDKLYNNLRNDSTILCFFDEYYNMNKEVRCKSEELVYWKIPRGIIDSIQAIQQYLLKKIDTKKIAIETCPTSNCMIGPFDKYIELPLFTFINELPNNAISINTDDKGIISTSIENEYALISVAMKKNKKSNSEILNIMKRIQENAAKSKFKLIP